MVKYEYIIQHTQSPPDTDPLDRLGEEGWELVSVVRLTDTWRMYFKRMVK